MPIGAAIGAAGLLFPSEMRACMACRACRASRALLWWWCCWRLAEPAESQSQSWSSLSAPAPTVPWEQFVEALAQELQSKEYQAMHFLYGQTMEPSTSLLRRLSENSTTSYTLSHNGPKKPVILGTLPPYNVFLVLGMNSTVPCEAVRALSGTPKGLVVLVSTLPRRRFFSDMGRTFDTCWRNDMLQVVAAHVTARGDSSLDAYTYFPYRPGACLVMEPKYLFTWRPGARIRYESLAMHQKASNLHQCQLRVVTFEAVPWVSMFKNNDPSNYTIMGTYAKLMYAIANSLNFSAVFTLPSDGQLYGDGNNPPLFGGLMGDVYHNRSDLGLAFTSGDLTVPYHARPATAQTCCTTWCLPTGYKTSPLWRPLVGAFLPDAWGALGAAYLVGAVSFRVLVQGTTESALLMALQALLSGAAPEPRGGPARAFLFCYLFFGVVTTNVYLAALHSISTTETDATVFRTLKEVADSDIPLYIVRNHYEAFGKAHFDTRSEQDIIKRVTIFEIPDLYPVYTKLHYERNIAVLVDSNACAAYASVFMQNLTAPPFHSIRSYCLAVSGAYNFVLRKESPLLRRITQVMSRLDESGLTLFWTTLGSRNADGEADPVMRVRQLRPFAALLGVGLGLAVIAFFVEILCHRVSVCRARRQGIRAKGVIVKGIAAKGIGGKGNAIKDIVAQSTWDLPPPRHEQPSALPPYYAPGQPPQPPQPPQYGQHEFPAHIRFRRYDHTHPVPPAPYFY